NADIRLHRSISSADRITESSNKPAKPAGPILTDLSAHETICRDAVGTSPRRRWPNRAEDDRSEVAIFAMRFLGPRRRRRPNDDEDCQLSQGGQQEAAIFAILRPRWGQIRYERVSTAGRNNMIA